MVLLVGWGNPSDAETYIMSNNWLEFIKENCVIDVILSIAEINVMIKSDIICLTNQEPKLI